MCLVPVAASLQIGSQWSPPPASYNLVYSPSALYHGLSLWPIENGRSVIMAWLRLSYTLGCSLIHALFLSYDIPWRKSYLEQIYGEVHMASNWSFLPKVTWVGLELNSPTVVKSLETMALANNLTYPAKPFPDFWFLECMWGDKFLIILSYLVLGSFVLQQ